MTVPTTNTTRGDRQVVFKNLTSVHLECLIEHPGSERVGCLNKVIGTLLQRTPVAPESLEESVTLLAPGQAFRPKSAAPGQRWLFRERFSGKVLFRHEISAASDRELFFQLQSKERDEEVEVLFRNETTLDLELYWVDFDGRERLMKTLAPAETYQRHTFVNHVWMARDAYSKIPLDVIVVDPLADTYPIRSDHMLSRPGAETANVVFKNVTPIPLTFNWVGPDGEEVTKFTLGPGEFTGEGMNTGLGHVWRVRGGPENEEIKLILPGARARQFYEVKMAEFAGNPATEVTFVNETMLDVDLFLVGPAGDHFRFKGLSPKESFVQATFATHEWLVRDARTDVLLATITAQPAPTTVHINSRHVRSQPAAPPTRARFDNRSPFIIRVVSIDPEGQETELETLLPGQDGAEHEANDHVWRFIDDMTGREISQFIARPGESLQHEIVVRSIHSRAPAGITIHNETHLTVDVFWLDYEGNEQRMQTLATGAACTMDTYLTHPWLVRDARSGHLLESIFGQMAAQQITITDEDIISYKRGGKTTLTVTNSLPFSVELYALSETDETAETSLASLAPNDDIQLEELDSGVVLRARQRRSQQLIANLIPKDVVDEFELKLRAVHSHYATEIEFVNESPLTVTLHRVDFDGNEHEEDTLEPFDFVVRETFATHPWVVRDRNSGVPVANTIGLSRPQTLRIRADHLYHMQRPDAQNVRVNFTNGSRIALDVFRVDQNGRERRLFTTRPLAPETLEDFFRFDFNSFVPQERRFPAGSIFRAYKAGTRQLADVYILNDTDEQAYTLRNKLVREGLRLSGELREGEVALFSEKNFQGKAWIARTDVPFFRDLGDADDVEDIANDILGDIEDFFRPLTDFFDGLFLSPADKERKEKERRQKEEEFFNSLDNQISSIKVGPNTQAVIFRGANFAGVNDVILMDAPDLRKTDVGDDQISSLQIVTTAGALETNISSSATLSEEYRTEKDAVGKTKLVRDTAGAPLTFPVYRSSITLPPDVDQVDVWATEALTIEVEGQTYDIDPVKPARLAPNLAQKLLINIEATGLGAPALQLRTNTMRERDRFLLFPDQDVSRKLAALPPGQMWRDRAQLGLPAELSEKDVVHLQYAVQTVAGAAGYQGNTSPREGRYIITDNMEYAAWSLDFGRDGAAGGPSYKPLSDSALAELTAGAVLIDDGLTQDFFGDAWNATKQGARAVGEGTVGAAKAVDRVVVQPVARTTVDTANTVNREVLQPTAEFANKEIVDPVNDNVIQPAKEVAEREIIEPVRRDVIEPAAEFIEEEVVDPVVENVKKAKEDIDAFVQEALAVTIQAGETINTVIVDTPEKALALSEHLLTELGAAAEDVVEWLEDTFSWNDILEMHDLILNFVEVGLEHMQGELPKMAALMVDMLDRSEERLLASLEDMAGNIVVPEEDQSASFQEDARQQEGGDLLDWLLSKLIDGESGSWGGFDLGLESSPDLTSNIEQFMTTLETNMGDFPQQLGTAMERVFANFAEALAQPERAVNLILAGISEVLQLAVRTGFAIFKNLIASLFALMQQLLRFFQSVLHTRIEIPVVTELYAQITGGRALTLASLSSLLIALPASTLLKLSGHSLDEIEDANLVPIALANGNTTGKIILAILFSGAQLALAATEVITQILKDESPEGTRRHRVRTHIRRKKLGNKAAIGIINFFISFPLQLCVYPLSFDLLTPTSPDPDDIEGAPIFFGLLAYLSQWPALIMNAISVIDTGNHPLPYIVTTISGGFTSVFYIFTGVAEGKRAEQSEAWRNDISSGAFARRMGGNFMDSLPALLSIAQTREKPNVRVGAGALSAFCRVVLTGIVIGRLAANEL